MTIRKKPTNIAQEAKINAVIQKGGSAAKSPNQDYRITLRMPTPLKLQVEELIHLDPAQPSLTAWILEALKQRVQREKLNENSE